MIFKKYDRDGCINLLRGKYAALDSKRYPQRADFDDAEVVAIKAFLGPWPRALEAAGIKPPRDRSRAEENIQKRIRSKRRRVEEKKLKKRTETASAAENGVSGE